MKIENKEYWRKRPKNIMKEYWKTIDHPHRQLILNELAKISFKSLLEVGCGCGPNLALIQKKYSQVKLTGIDINASAIKFGQKKLAKVFLFPCDVKEMLFAARSFDVILADAILMYVEPQEIEYVISLIAKTAKKAIIVCDWHQDKAVKEMREYNHWVRDYPRLFLNYLPKAKIDIVQIKEWPESDGWQIYGHIITIKL